MFGYLKKISLIYLIFTFIISGQAMASPEDAIELIKKSEKDVLEVLGSNAMDTDKKEHELARMFDKIIDISWIARFSLGRHWNNITQEQKEEYIRLNHALLFKRYLPEIREFPSQKVEYKKSLDLGDDEYIVQTKLISMDGTSANVDYKIRKYSGDVYKIFDVVSDGISMINTQRLEFSSILNRKDMEYLIYKLGVKSASAHKYLVSMSF